MKSYHSLVIPFLLAAGLINSCRNNPGQSIIPNPAGQITSSNADTGLYQVVSPVIPDRKITVGGAGADINGFTSQAIQSAIDALHFKGGGGTVYLNPGNYEIIAPVKLYSNMALVGSGPSTILKKCKGNTVPFITDADYGELQITVADASGFRPGMGVAIYDDDQRTGWALTTARIAEIKGNIIYLDDYLQRDYRADRNGKISNACSVIEAIGSENIRIENLSVDGTGKSNSMIDGCRAGGIYLHKVKNAVIEKITVKDFNSDGISWQITENVTVRGCDVSGCTNSGLHPGTGSPRTLIEYNNSHDNGGYGLFVCWRVKDGVVRNNQFHDNGINGISTGHKDTKMLFTDNSIFNNGEDGITLRGETPGNEPNGTIIMNNKIQNNGMKKESYGISIYSRATDVVIESNTIENTGNGKQVAAVYLSENSLPVMMKGNKISGMLKGELVKSEKSRSD